MAPKGGQETQQRSNELATGQFGQANVAAVDLNPTKDGIQREAPGLEALKDLGLGALRAPVKATEEIAIRHLGTALSESQRFILRQDGPIANHAPREVLREADKIFEPVAIVKAEYVAMARAERGLDGGREIHDGSIERIRNMKKPPARDFTLAA